MSKKWFGTPPTKCDICHKDIKTEFVDGKTQMGPWGILCKGCHFMYGIGLGVGRGQKYAKEGDDWVKIEG